MTTCQAPVTRRHLHRGNPGSKFSPWISRAWTNDNFVLVVQAAFYSCSNGAKLRKCVRSGVEIRFKAKKTAGGNFGQALRLVYKDGQYLLDGTFKRTQELIALDFLLRFACLRLRRQCVCLGQVRGSGRSITLVRVLSETHEIQGVEGMLTSRTSYECVIYELLGLIHRIGLDIVAVTYVDDDFDDTCIAASEQAAMSIVSKLLAKLSLEMTLANVRDSLFAVAEQYPQSGLNAMILVAFGHPEYACISAFHPQNLTRRVFGISVASLSAIAKRCYVELAFGIGFFFRFVSFPVIKDQSGVWMSLCLGETVNCARVQLLLLLIRNKSS
jgi:hypothetical protein